LACFLRTQKHYEQAEKHFQQAVRIYEQAPTIDAGELAPVLNNFGVLYLDWECPDEAEPLFIRALTLWRRSARRDLPNTTIALKNLGRLALLQGDTPLALTWSEQALHIVSEKLGETDLEVMALEQTCQSLRAQIKTQ
jgi:tetratricopeptide (TPR) repeat protein